MILMDGRFTDSLRVVPAGGGELRPGHPHRPRGRTRSAARGRASCRTASTSCSSATSGSVSDGGNIRLGKIGSLDSKLLGQSDGRVEYAPGGWVLFLRGTDAARAEARPRAPAS